jgi:hypothetical protein
MFLKGKISERIEQRPQSSTGGHSTAGEKLSIVRLSSRRSLKSLPTPPSCGTGACRQGHDEMMAEEKNKCKDSIIPPGNNNCRKNGSLGV